MLLCGDNLCPVLDLAYEKVNQVGFAVRGHVGDEHRGWACHGDSKDAENYGAVAGIWVVSLGPLAVIIVVMYRWVSAYNLEHFGYASKSERDEARREGLE